MHRTNDDERVISAVTLGWLRERYAVAAKLPNAHLVLDTPFDTYHSGRSPRVLHAAGRSCSAAATGQHSAYRRHTTTLAELLIAGQICSCLADNMGLPGTYTQVAPMLLRIDVALETIEHTPHIHRWYKWHSTGTDLEDIFTRLDDWGADLDAAPYQAFQNVKARHEQLTTTIVEEWHTQRFSTAGYIAWVAYEQSRAAKKPLRRHTKTHQFYRQIFCGDAALDPELRMEYQLHDIDRLWTHLEELAAKQADHHNNELRTAILQTRELSGPLKAVAVPQWGLADSRGGNLAVIRYPRFIEPAFTGSLIHTFPNDIDNSTAELILELAGPDCTTSEQAELAVTSALAAT